jgi:hypothetical protein
MRNKRSRFGLGLALAVAAGLGLAAQGAPASQVPAVPQSRPAPTPRATVRQPDFRSSVDVVTMDAIVRNNQDQFVADLTKADFEVFEDGVRQEIASLTLVHGGRVYNPAALAAA